MKFLDVMVQKLELTERKRGERRIKKNNNQHENNTSSTEWEDVSRFQLHMQLNVFPALFKWTCDLDL